MDRRRSRFTFAVQDRYRYQYSWYYTNMKKYKP